MTRFSGAANQTGAALPHVNIATLVKLELGSGTLYLMDAPGKLSWDGQTWLGVGGFGSVSAVEEGTDDTPKPITLTLSGIDSALVTAALTEHYYGKSCTLYSAWFDENGALLADPEPEWEGRISDMDVTVGHGSSSIEVNCESRLIIWSRTNGAEYTDEDQQHKFAGDPFFDQMAVQADQAVIWGKLKTAFGSGVVPSRPDRVIP